MALRFIGIDPDTGQQGSPTILPDEEKKEFVFQGRLPDEQRTATCMEFEISGQAPGIPPREAIVRVPTRMVRILRQACDVAE
ncbi:hypothetical protein [Streptomyces tsukubensis]|uniref:Uncharacterized protein n=1 Tax=Streptomyces tsukubensis TaxID=83656 RepID=A0A1V4A2A4_9ACTN|nr:hypothetical protein [Streptomyces tsukubensis]OON72980.1 hypothetical protein B1H18_27845 [Streptomyces tsukubensis]QFR93963.1 hypothetical protein GBW32_13945 [Streptomyces tsukubensis]